ncbi:unnamed protein product [Brachionus calyciflorus]|uniref:Uncharacterized protein n=1 Tax=Brachionus calyciflorus TaxID=104777 RepID=A0A813NGT4_9BILA|nr:unnamed protein product [Brachionus calyciflorus]
MTSELFIEYFKKHLNDDLFYFKNFFNENSSLFQSKNTRISLNKSHIHLLHEIKEIILINLSKNNFFLENDGFNLSHIQKIFNIFISTRQGYDEHQASKLCLLHNLSNSKINKPDDLPKFLNNIETIFVLNNESIIIFKEELSKLFNRFKERTIVKLKISNALQKFLNCEDQFFNCDNFSKLRLKFFNSDNLSLIGFVGIDTIYLNNKRNEIYLKKFQENNLGKDQILKVFQLNLADLFVNFGSIILLRHKSDDFNISIFNDSAFKHDLFELQEIVEKEFFTQRIDWFNSALNSNFNIEYFYNILETILNNNEVKFDASKIGSIVSYQCNAKYFGIHFDELI